MKPPTETPPCPPIHLDLIAHLTRLYRIEIEVPFKETSAWDIGNRAGKRHVLDYLERRIREQEQESLNVLVKTKDP